MTDAPPPVPDDATGTGSASKGWRTAAVLAAVVVLAVVLTVIASLVFGESANDDAAPSDATPAASLTPGATPDADTTGGDPTPPGDVPASTGESPDDALPAVEIGQDADFGDGVTARVTSLRAVQGDAQGAGEIGGPAVAVSITLTNDSGDSVLLTNAVVNAYYGKKQTPAAPLFGDGRSEPFSGTLKDGGTAEGVYVFAVPSNARATFLVTVSYIADQPVVAFEGSAPR